MKIILITVCLLGFVLLGSGDSSHEKDPFAYDATMKEISLRAFNQTGETKLLLKEFELNAQLGNVKVLQELLVSSKSLTTKLGKTLSDLKAFIASLTQKPKAHALLMQIITEMERFPLETNIKLLKAMSLEILGQQNGISQIPSYQYSEGLALTTQMIGTKINTGMVKLGDADKLLNDAHQKDPIKAIDANTKARVDRLLKDSITILSAGKVQFAAEYYGEAEKLRVHHQELNLVQRFEFEMHIDMLNFLIEFTGKFEELFMKFNYFLLF